MHVIQKTSKYGSTYDAVCPRCHGWGFAQVPGEPGGAIVILCPGPDESDATDAVPDDE